MPTIPASPDRGSEYPDAPPAIDINPSRFGRDAAAMASMGGEIADFGNKLIAVRKQAEDAEAFSNAVTDDAVEFAKMERDAQAAGPGPVNKGWSVRGEQPVSMADSLQKKMRERSDGQMKALPSDEARRRYRTASQGQIAEAYARNIKWERRQLSEGYLVNIGERNKKLTLENYQDPSLEKALSSIEILKQDIDGNTGTVLSAQDAPVAYRELGGNIVKSYFNGLADASVEMSTEKRLGVIAHGREILKNPPKGFAALLAADDVKALSAKLDSAEREGRVNDSYRVELEKKATQERRDAVQNQLLTDIYEGRGSVKNILRSNLDPDKKQVMLNVLKARLNEPKIPNPNVLREVVERIYADGDDPRKITTEDQVTRLYTKGNLTWDQKQKAISELRSMGKVGGQVEVDLKRQLLKQADATLVKRDALGMADPDGQEAMAKFTSYVLSEIERQKSEGKPVRDLLDANSPNYLGKAIANYRKTPQEIMRAQIDRMRMKSRSAPTPVNPSTAPEGKVLMIRPDGVQGYVPKARADYYRKRGYKEAK